MAKIREAVEAINGKVIYSSESMPDDEIQFVVACDLMSDVLVVDEDDILLVTSLVSRQSLKTAHLVGAHALVIVNDKAVPEDLIELADELELTLIGTPMSKFSACVALGKLLGK
ncbi:MAG: hypothetical protein EOL87_04835 [Spartobacteria bacterium]|nr:hypothetical protein [Spartobacteria bacterium]